jgi:hypothetical protein
MNAEANNGNCSGSQVKNEPIYYSLDAESQESSGGGGRGSRHMASPSAGASPAVNGIKSEGIQVDPAQSMNRKAKRRLSGIPYGSEIRSEQSGISRSSPALPYPTLPCPPLPSLPYPSLPSPSFVLLLLPQIEKIIHLRMLALRLFGALDP